MTNEVNQHSQHGKIVGLVWSIANIIRGPWQTTRLMNSTLN